MHYALLLVNLYFVVDSLCFDGIPGSYAVLNLVAVIICTMKIAKGDIAQSG